MRFKKFLALLLAVVLSFSLFACGKKPVEENKPQTSTQTVTDAIGRTLEITPGQYKKIVCVGAGALRMYSYIGDVSLLAGVEDIDNLSLENRPKMFDGVARPYVLAFGETFKTLPSCGVGGPKAQAAESEKILSCAPDLVLSEYEDADKAAALEKQLGVPVVTLKIGPKGVFDENFKASMRLLGTVLDKAERAETLLSFIDKEAAEISRRTKDIQDSDKPSVYICGLGNWGTTNHLMTAQNYPAFEVAHVKNVVTDMQQNGIGPIEKEKFEALGADMDILIVDAAAIKNIRPLYKEDANLFQNCKAVKEGKVFLELPYNAYYTNFEIALTNTWFIAKSVYPTQFADIDMTEKTNEITQMFLGKPLAEEMFRAPQSFGGYGQVDLPEILK